MPRAATSLTIWLPAACTDEVLSSAPRHAEEKMSRRASMAAHTAADLRMLSFAGSADNNVTSPKSFVTSSRPLNGRGKTSVAPKADALDRCRCDTLSIRKMTLADGGLRRSHSATPGRAAVLLRSISKSVTAPGPERSASWTDAICTSKMPANCPGSSSTSARASATTVTWYIGAPKQQTRRGNPLPQSESVYDNLLNECLRL